jgi:cardiolipin synthase (CMP-forming)
LFTLKDQSARISDLRCVLTAPNIVTSTRLVLLPAIWFFAYKEMPRAVGYAIAISLMTDMLDGFLARYLNQETNFGAKLDSLADNLLLVSAPVWLFWIDRRVVIENPVLCAMYIVALAAVFIAMLTKHKRNVEIHTYLSKLGASMMWIFLIYVCVIGYNKIFFFVTMTFSYLYLAEDFILLTTRDRINETVKGLFFH